MNGGLTPAQQAEAARIYAIAVHRGVPPARARELVQAAYSESGLNAGATNKSSGAAGDFQLLSSGYVQKANELGGVHDTRANTLAILPSYEHYWQQHPNARPGEAGRDVERSGEGAGFYNPQLELGFLGAGGAPVAAAAPAADPRSMIDPQARAQFAAAIINNIGHKGPPDFGALTAAITGLHAATAAPAAVASEQQPDAGAIVKGSYAFPVAGPSNFTDTWGAYRGDIPGGHHQGTDIFAKRGTPVVAVVDGTVTKMGPSAIGGNRVWINGKYYYAHLDAFAPGLTAGTRVRRGQVIGYVGDTGDAKGTPTHLHFGYSPDASQGGSWANPYGLLSSLHG